MTIVKINLEQVAEKRGAMGFNKGTLPKLIACNAALLAVNVVVFSNLFFKVRLLGGGALEAAAGWTVLIMSVVVFFYGNLRILNAPVKRPDPKDTVDKITGLESCGEALERMGRAGTFAAKIEEMQGQVEQMGKKQELIRDILLQKFSDTEMSYQKFQTTVNSAEGVLCLNVRSVLNRIYAFDEEEYTALARGKSRLKPAIAAQKMDIYKQYIDFVDQAVEDNDEILLRLDRLLLEISKFNSIDVGELERMPAMKELDSLITDTKWYR